MFDSRGYTISNAGNISEVEDFVGTDTRDYGYDNLDRLTWDSKATTSSPTYTYDANGNRLTRAAGTYATQSATYVANSNRQTGITYDGMGNQTATAGGTQFFAYAASGRLGLVQEALDALRLDYNGLGELARTRLERQDLCTVDMILLAEDDYNFLPDGRALSRRTTNTVAVNADYVWLDNLPVAQFQDSYDSQGTYQGTTVTYLHADHLGTPRLGTNASQQVTWRYESDAFGIATLSGTAVVGLRLPGQQSLGIAGLNYNYYRDYVPDRGRYLESDPIGIDGGLNTYGYAVQNPVSYTDPTGHGPLSAAFCETFVLTQSIRSFFETVSDVVDGDALILGQLARVEREQQECDTGTAEGVKRWDALESIRRDLNRALIAGQGGSASSAIGHTAAVAASQAAVASSICAALWKSPLP